VIGSKNGYSGIIFAQNGVINIIINYRLGIRSRLTYTDQMSKTLSSILLINTHDISKTLLSTVY
jgi:carboxylesterase type B